MIRMIVEVFKRYPFKQKRKILAVGVGLLGVMLGVRMVVLGDLNRLRSGEYTYKETEKKAALAADIAVMRRQVDAYKDIFSSTGEPDWMIEALRKSAADTGLSLLSISPQRPERDENFEKISLLVEAEGGYHQVGKFAEKIENFKPFIFLSHLRLEKPESSLPQGRLKIFMVLSSFREIPGAAR